MQQTRKMILEYLRRNGTGTVEELAAYVGLAPVTVRHHLTVLRRQERVQYGTRRSGRGRPRHVFSLTPDGAQALTTDQYEVLAGRLLDAIGRGGGRTVGETLSSMADQLALEVRRAMIGRPVEERLDAAMELLASEGFTARWERQGDGFLVRVMGCPYRQLASQNESVCQFDIELVHAVTQLEVTKVGSCMLEDGECRFLVTGA
jgi:predicted ArsR family transcriptional regulator